MQDNNVTETKAEDTGILKIALMIAFIVFGVYGLIIFLLPGLLVRMSSAPMIELIWVRWAGGMLIAIAVGIYRVYKEPANQEVFVVSVILAALLNSVAHVISLLLGDYSGATWFIVLPTILTLVITILLLWGRNNAKDLLQSGD